VWGNNIAVAAEIIVFIFILLRYISASTGSGSAELSLLAKQRVFACSDYAW
jgi:hypothetical protein